MLGTSYRDESMLSSASCAMARTVDGAEVKVVQIFELCQRSSCDIYAVV